MLSACGTPDKEALEAIGHLGLEAKSEVWAGNRDLETIGRNEMAVDSRRDEIEWAVCVIYHKTLLFSIKHLCRPSKMNMDFNIKNL